MATRRTKNDQPLGSPRSRGDVPQVGITDLRNIAAPTSGQSEVVTLRLSGTWHTIWQQLKRELPDISDSEILRQAVALRIALVAVDSKGQKPDATISFHDEFGKKVTVNLEEHVGIRS